MSGNDAKIAGFEIRDNSQPIGHMSQSHHWRDNVFVGQLWKNVKYKERKLHDDSINEAKRGLEKYVTY